MMNPNKLLVALGVRRVRTPEGQRLFDQPIGSIIKPDLIPSVRDNWAQVQSLKAWTGGHLTPGVRLTPKNPARDKALRRVRTLGVKIHGEDDLSDDGLIAVVAGLEAMEAKTPGFSKLMPAVILDHIPGSVGAFTEETSQRMPELLHQPPPPIGTVERWEYDREKALQGIEGPVAVIGLAAAFYSKDANPNEVSGILRQSKSSGHSLAPYRGKTMTIREGLAFIFMHEAGHAISYLTTFSRLTYHQNDVGMSAMSNAEWIRMLQDERLLNGLALNSPEIRKKVSGYATRNMRELMAELWAEYMISDNPRPIARRTGDLVVKTYERMRGNYGVGTA